MLNGSAHEAATNKAPSGFGSRPRYNKRIYVPNASARDNAIRLKQTVIDFMEGYPNLIGILAGSFVIGTAAVILFFTINWKDLYACTIASDAVVAARPLNWAAHFGNCSVYWNLTGQDGGAPGVTVSGDFVGPHPGDFGNEGRNQRYRVFMTYNHGFLKALSVYLSVRP